MASLLSLNESTVSVKKADSEETQQINVNIYRYTFDDYIKEELYKFAKIHEFDDRKQFKEAWDLWKEENDELIQREIYRLNSLGCEGDIMDKMFKSARYYYRKKSTEKKRPSVRRNYINVGRDIIKQIDEHIKTNLMEGSMKPCIYFDDFKKNHSDLVNQFIELCNESGMTDTTEIWDKLKKTYKNRYFIAKTNFVIN